MLCAAASWREHSLPPLRFLEKQEQRRNSRLRGGMQLDFFQWGRNQKVLETPLSAQGQEIQSPPTPWTFPPKLTFWISLPVCTPVPLSWRNAALRRKRHLCKMPFKRPLTSLLISDWSASEEDLWRNRALGLLGQEDPCPQITRFIQIVDWNLAEKSYFFLCGHQCVVGLHGHLDLEVNLIRKKNPYVKVLWSPGTVARIAIGRFQ